MTSTSSECRVRISNTSPGDDVRIGEVKDGIVWSVGMGDALVDDEVLFVKMRKVEVDARLNRM